MKIINKIIVIIILLAIALLILFLVVVLYLPVKLLKYIVNQTNTAVRRKGKTLYVPIVEFFNKQTSQQVSFLGCMHIGNQGYYQTLEHIIAQSPNALVLCEGTKETFTDEKKIREHDYTTLASLLGVVTQFTMQYQPTWEFNDLPDESLKQLSNVMKLLRSKKDGQTLAESIKEMDRKKRKAMSSLISSLMLNMTFWKLIFGMRKKNRREKVLEHHIVHVRNEHAINEVDKKIDVPHIILLWGAAHLKGMEKLLLQRGFKKQSVKWIPAFTKQKYLN